MGILAAYAHRLKTGDGQMVETSLLEAGIVQTYWQSAIALATGEAPGPDGLGAPAERALPGLRDRRRLDRDRRQQPKPLAAHARGRSAPSTLADDPRFRRQRRPHGAPDRARGRRLPPTSSAAPATTCWPPSTTRACRPARSTTSCRCTPIPRSAPARWWSRSSTPSRPRWRRWASRSSSRHARQRRTGAPVYGQHTREVLADHGFAEAEIAALLAEGAIVAAPA